MDNQTDKRLYGVGIDVGPGRTAQNLHGGALDVVSKGAKSKIPTRLIGMRAQGKGSSVTNNAQIDVDGKYNVAITGLYALGVTKPQGTQVTQGFNGKDGVLSLKLTQGDGGSIVGLLSEGPNGRVRNEHIISLSYEGKDGYVLGVVVADGAQGTLTKDSQIHLENTGMNSKVIGLYVCQDSSFGPFGGIPIFIGKTGMGKRGLFSKITNSNLVEVTSTGKAGYVAGALAVGLGEIDNDKSGVLRVKSSSQAFGMSTNRWNRPTFGAGKNIPVVKTGPIPKTVYNIINNKGTIDVSAPSGAGVLLTTMTNTIGTVPSSTYAEIGMGTIGGTITVDGANIHGIIDHTIGKVSLDTGSVTVKSGRGYGILSHRNLDAKAYSVNMEKGTTGDGVRLASFDGKLTQSTLGEKAVKLPKGLTINVKGQGNGAFANTALDATVANFSTINMLDAKSGNAVKTIKTVKWVGNAGEVTTVADKPAFDLSVGTRDFYNAGGLTATGKGQAVLMTGQNDRVTFGTASHGQGIVDASGGEDTLVLTKNVKELSSTGPATGTVTHDFKNFSHMTVDSGTWSLGHNLTLVEGLGTERDLGTDRYATGADRASKLSGKLIIPAGKELKMLVNVGQSLKGQPSLATTSSIVIKNGRTATVSAGSVDIQGKLHYVLTDGSWVALAGAKPKTTVSVTNIYTKNGVKGQSSKTVSIDNAPKDWKTTYYESGDKKVLGVKLVRNTPPVVTPPIVTPKPPIVTPKPPIVTPKPPIVTPKPPVVTPAGGNATSCVQLVGGQLVSICSYPRNRVNLDTENMYRRNGYKALSDAAQKIHNAQIPNSQNVTIIGSYGKYWNDSVNTDYSSQIYGFTGTTLHKFTEDIVGGLQYGYTRAHISYDDSGKSTENLNSYGVGLYGSYNPDFWSFKGHVNYLFSKHDLKRRLNAVRSDTKAPIREVYGASFNSHIVSAGAEISRDFDVSTRWTIKPVLGLDYTWIHEGSYTEKYGSDEYRLMVDGMSVSSLASRLGLSVRREGRVGLYGGAFWEHEFLNQSDSKEAHFVGYRNKGFEIPELETNRDIFTAELGLSYNITDRLIIDAKYTGEYNKHFMNHSGNVRLRFEF